MYKAFDPATADRVAAKLAWHYTPPHGSWLNLAASEISVLARPYLRRRVATREALADEVAAWCRHRNRDPVPRHWRFTTAQARNTLCRLYPPV